MEDYVINVDVTRAPESEPKAEGVPKRHPTADIRLSISKNDTYVPEQRLNTQGQA